MAHSPCRLFIDCALATKCIYFFVLLQLHLLFFVFDPRCIVLSFHLNLVGFPIGDHLDSGTLGHEESVHADVEVCTFGSTSIIIVVVLCIFLRCHNQFFLLFLELCLCSLDLALRLGVGRVDDSQGQIQQEKGSDEDHGNEEEEHPWGVGLLVHDHDLGPALHSDALEDIEEGPGDVVEVSHVIVGVESVLAAEVPRGANLLTADDLFTFIVQGGNARIDGDAALHEQAHEQVQATDGEDEEEKE